MPGARAEQAGAARDWLTKELNPAREVPATQETWRIEVRTIPGGYGNTLPKVGSTVLPSISNHAQRASDARR